MEKTDKLSESNDFEYQMNSAAARLLSTTLSASPSVPSLTASADPVVAPGKTALNSTTSTSTYTTTGLNGSVQLHSKTTTMESTIPSQVAPSPPSVNASNGENKMKTSLMPSMTSSPSSSVAIITVAETGKLHPQNDCRIEEGLKFENGENSLNFDRGKKLWDDDGDAEIADEARDEDKQERLTSGSTTGEDLGSSANKTTNEDCDSQIDADTKHILGCVHYKRRAMFVTPCCNKFYKCRYCHDENEDHHFDRKTLTELICSECDTRQRVQETCENCGVRFGKYTCLICNLFDDEDKAQYHCYGCGICRIGGRKNFFHCEVCNMCLPIQLKIEGHRCVENISRSNCPVCLGDIHTSRIPCHIPDCGHLLHKMCFDQLLASGHYVCPTCQTSIIDMTKMWEYLDAQALMMPVPKIYEDRYLNIFCNDCHKQSTVKFHFIGLKCFYCGGYNTTQDGKRRRSRVNPSDSFPDNASSA